jgi:uncharacterized protein (TIGR02246 family)
MSRTSRLIFLALLLLISVSPTWAAKPVAEAVKEATQEFVNAVAAGDANRISALYSNGAQLFPSESDVVSGTENIRNYWAGFLKSGVKSARFQTTELIRNGDFAYEVGRYSVGGADGKELDHGKFIVIWRLERDRWRMHRDIWNSSVPAK